VYLCLLFRVILELVKGVRQDIDAVAGAKGGAALDDLAVSRGTHRRILFLIIVLGGLHTLLTFPGVIWFMLADKTVDARHAVKHRDAAGLQVVAKG
jgi:hypothetical protein